MSYDAPFITDNHTRYLTDESATLSIGAQLAHVLTPGLVVYLVGDLGAGKTTLSRGVLRGLGYAGKVKSPTYALVEVYSLFNFDLYHFDLYRFNYALEWEESGFGEYCHAHSVCLIEWPEKGAGCLPNADVQIVLQSVHDGRQIHIHALTDKGKLCLQQRPFE